MKILPLDNDWEPEWPITRKNAASGDDEPASGLAGLTARLSATDGGTTIHASLSVSLAERSGAPGVYYGTIQGDDLRAQLVTYIGKVVYEVVGDGTNVFISVPRKVVERRRAA